MKPSVHGSQKVDVFSAEFCADLLPVLDSVPDAYWTHRTKINSIPTQGTTEADYRFMGHNQFPKALRAMLFKTAPQIAGALLEEICINRYDEGNFMPEHVDVAFYRYNLVVALNEHGDGVVIDGVFHPDQPGQGVVFPIRSEPHSVPPVKHKRYVLIYLYS
jgi:hypothetical protein